MKRFFIGIGILIAAVCCYAQSWQNVTLDRNMPETYVLTTLKETQLRDLAQKYSIDKVKRDENNAFVAQICVARKDYADFEALNIPFSIVTPAKANVSMATNYTQLTQAWSKYPTYSTYLSAMATFQSEFPNLCEIDTILASTPGGRSLLVAHISNDLQNRGSKPAFFYTSTMHGDEPVGYYLMLRLIHYLLNNYATDAYVQYLVNNIDIWICPLENPDGTYHSGNNTLNESPTSTRYNYHGEDLNRSFPWAGQSTSNRSYEPEVKAMMDFGAAHPFVMSANFHGGAEVVNYPWDMWTSNQRSHADMNWWNYQGRKFADTCHKQSMYYMSDLNYGVTEGADWYAITGSRQDYYNYYLNCREMTVEVSTNKVVSSNNLPQYWSRIYRSLLNYMAESLNGLQGTVTDSLTGQAVEAKIYIADHDRDNSFVYSHLPEGDYHRPIKAGTYNVTFSADGYYSKTISMTVTDGEPCMQEVQLVPVNDGTADYRLPQVCVYPNPAHDGRITCRADSRILYVEVLDMSGRYVMVEHADDAMTKVDLQQCVPGQYLLRVVTEKGTYVEKIMVK